MNSQNREILLIDDQQDKLESLAEQVRVKVDVGTVQTWCPREGENPSEAFDDLAGDNTVLVVTDYDLTTAVKGLFGHSVVAWCRNRLIPVGDFSRGHKDALSVEPDLFELRVPRGDADAAAYIVRMFEGFRRIRDEIELKAELLKSGQSPAEVLAHLLGRSDLESQLAPYLSKPGLFNSSLLDKLTSGQQVGEHAKAVEKTKLLTYILGHVLVNAVLKYPGPILAEGPFCAYLATSDEDVETVARLFKSARYKGPFDDGERFFWRDKVDAVVEEQARKLEVDDSEFTSFGDYHRVVVAKALGGQIAQHGCKRCDGEKGGFWCPFTKRAVCELGDCSSTASSWVPDGAYACRVERGFFDEWSPILGL